MSQLTIEGIGTFEVAENKRLTIALIENGGDPLHRCGGNARCTTCKVQFLAGEPTEMNDAEKNKLSERGLLGQYRLSCQILCSQDMHVKVANPFGGSGLSDAGPALSEEITHG